MNMNTINNIKIKIQSIIPYVMLLRMFLVHINHLLHLIVASHKNPGPVVDMLRHYLEHSLHLAVHRLTATCFLDQPLSVPNSIEEHRKRPATYHSRQPST